MGRTVRGERLEIKMEAGMPGFPAARRFSVEPIGRGLSLLRSAEAEGPRFVVADARTWFPNVEVDIDVPLAERLGLSSPTDATVWVIVTPADRPSESTANLLGPIVLNRRTGRAAQVVATSGATTTEPLPR